jgi:hypothetical protein
VYLWEVATSKVWRRFPVEGHPPEMGKPFVDVLRLSADGKWLAAITRTGDFDGLRLDVWDTATGQLVKSRKFERDPFACFTHDVKGVAVHLGDGLVIQDTITGTHSVAIPGVVERWARVAFSPDGKLLAVACGQADGEVRAVRLVEVATATEILQIETGKVDIIAFAPDGQMLATADSQVVHVWRVATGSEVFRRPRHESLPGGPAQAPVTAIALFPGGRILATGLADGTVLEWNLPLTKSAEKLLTPPELDRLWADLAGRDARQAYHAIHVLVAAPTQAVTYLQGHLQPVAEIDAKDVQRLLTDLDNERFDKREAAMKELAALGKQVEPALRRVLDGKPSLEVRKRVETLLAASPTALPVATLRALRAIQILEWIGTPEARQVLQNLSTGAPTARSTYDAKAALERLAKRKR